MSGRLIWFFVFVREPYFAINDMFIYMMQIYIFNIIIKLYWFQFRQALCIFSNPCNDSTWDINWSMKNSRKKLHQIDRRLSQPTQCIRKISNNAPLCNRNVHLNRTLSNAVGLEHFCICATSITSRQVTCVRHIIIQGNWSVTNKVIVVFYKTARKQIK